MSKLPNMPKNPKIPNYPVGGYIIEAKSINPENYHRFVEGLRNGDGTNANVISRTSTQPCTRGALTLDVTLYQLRKSVMGNICYTTRYGDSELIRFGITPSTHQCKFIPNAHRLIGDRFGVISNLNHTLDMYGIEQNRIHYLADRVASILDGYMTHSKRGDDTVVALGNDGFGLFVQSNDPMTQDVHMLFVLTDCVVVVRIRNGETEVCVMTQEEPDGTSHLLMVTPYSFRRTNFIGVELLDPPCPSDTPDTQRPVNGVPPTPSRSASREREQFGECEGELLSRVDFLEAELRELKERERALRQELYNIRRSHARARRWQ